MGHVDSGMREFPTQTHWSLVRRAGSEDDAEARRAALEELLKRYRPALKKYLVFGRRMDEEAAEELLQEFIVGKVLEKHLIARAEPGKGRFRDLLVTALKRFHIDRIRHAARLAQKERPMGEDEDPAGDEATPARGLDVEWAREVIAQAIDGMKRECADKGRADLWHVFESQVLTPLLGGGGPAERYGELVKRLGLASPTQAHALLATAKRMFKRNLRDVVGRYEQTDEAVDEEIADLRRILAGGDAR